MYHPRIFFVIFILYELKDHSRVSFAFCGMPPGVIGVRIGKNFVDAKLLVSVVCLVAR
jgi:hypothetical protein